jgi:hypothetical protein
MRTLQNGKPENASFQKDLNKFIFVRVGHQTVQSMEQINRQAPQLHLVVAVRENITITTTTTS